MRTARPPPGDALRLLENSKALHRTLREGFSGSTGTPVTHGEFVTRCSKGRIWQRQTRSSSCHRARLSSTPSSRTLLAPWSRDLQEAACERRRLTGVRRSKGETRRQEERDASRVRAAHKEVSRIRSQNTYPTMTLKSAGATSWLPLTWAKTGNSTSPYTLTWPTLYARPADRRTRA